MSTVEREVERIRNWRHDLPAQIIMPLQDELVSMRQLIHGIKDEVGKPRAEMDRHITRREAWILATGASGGFAMALWLLNMFAPRG